MAERRQTDNRGGADGHEGDSEARRTRFSTASGGGGADASPSEPARGDGSRVGATPDARRDSGAGGPDGQTGSTGQTAALADDRTGGGVLAGLVTDDPWHPSSASERTTTVVRPYLRQDESIQRADTGQVVGGGGRPASVALTDDRLLVVTDDSLAAVDLDSLSGVRSSVETRLELRGMDFRLLGAVGYLLSVVTFLATLGVASNPLTPALTLVVGGGALAAGRLSRAGLDLHGRTLTDRLRVSGPLATLADALTGIERRLLGRSSADPLATWMAAAFAVVAFGTVAGLEGGLLTPLLVIATVGSFALVVYAVGHSDDLDGTDLVRLRRQRVSATTEAGDAVAVRVRPDSPLGRELAARVGDSSTPSSQTDD